MPQTRVAVEKQQADDSNKQQQVEANKESVSSVEKDEQIRVSTPDADAIVQNDSEASDPVTPQNNIDLLKRKSMRFDYEPLLDSKLSPLAREIIKQANNDKPFSPPIPMQDEEQEIMPKNVGLTGLPIFSEEQNLFAKKLSPAYAENSKKPLLDAAKSPLSPLSPPNNYTSISFTRNDSVPIDSIVKIAPQKIDAVNEPRYSDYVSPSSHVSASPHHVQDYEQIQNEIDAVKQSSLQFENDTSNEFKTVWNRIKQLEQSLIAGNGEAPNVKNAKSKETASQKEDIQLLKEELYYYKKQVSNFVDKLQKIDAQQQDLAKKIDDTAKEERYHRVKAEWEIDYVKRMIENHASKLRDVSSDMNTMRMRIDAEASARSSSFNLTTMPSPVPAAEKKNEMSFPSRIAPVMPPTVTSAPVVAPSVTLAETMYLDDNYQSPPASKMMPKTKPLPFNPNAQKYSTIHRHNSTGSVHNGSSKQQYDSYKNYKMEHLKHEVLKK